MSNTTLLPHLPAAHEMQEVKSWLLQHERLLIVLMVLLAGIFTVNKIENVIASRDAARATIAEQALVSQKTIDAQLAANTATITAQYQAMVVQLTNQNATLSKSITSRSAALQTQQGSDSQLPPSSLAQRVQELAAAPSGSVSAVGETVVLTQPGAVAVAQMLEEVPVLQANLNDTNQINTNLTKELVSANSLASAQSAQITGLKTELTDQVKADKAELASVKAKARKSKLRWFLIGVVTGFVGRGAV